MLICVGILHVYFMSTLGQVYVRFVVNVVITCIARNKRNPNTMSMFFV